MEVCAVCWNEIEERDPPGAGSMLFHSGCLPACRFCNRDLSSRRSGLGFRGGTEWSDEWGYAARLESAACPGLFGRRGAARLRGWVGDLRFGRPVWALPRGGGKYVVASGPAEGQLNWAARSRPRWRRRARSGSSRSASSSAAAQARRC